MKTHTDLLDGSARGRESATVSDPADQPHPAHKADAPPPPRLGRVFFIVLLIAAAAFVFGWLPRAKERAVVKSDARELAIPTVQLIAPAPAKAAPPLVLSGELKANAEASINARASGYVRRWLVDIGARVEQGQLLAELDTPELDRELAQARAELNQSEAARDLASTTAVRWREMLAGKTVSPQETDEKAADLELKKATVEASRAKVQRLEDLLGYNRITAPFAGTITARNLDVGQLVTEGAGRELFHLTQTDKLRVFVRVPQSYARAVAVGQTAELAAPELPGRIFAGKIARTAGAMDAASRTLLTEIEVDNSKGELLAGSYTQVRLIDAKPDAPLTLPSNTLLFRPEGPQVAVVANDRVSMRTVQLGRDFGTAVEILVGLTDAERVVLNPADSLVDGVEVRVAQPVAP